MKKYLLIIFKDVINHLYKNFMGHYDFTLKTYNINDANKKLFRGRRSVRSIYNIVKYYFPKTTNKEFFSYLKELVVNEKLIIHYCGTVKNLVCTRYLESIKNSVNKPHTVKINVYNSGYGSKIDVNKKIKGISYNNLIDTFTELN